MEIASMTKKIYTLQVDEKDLSATQKKSTSAKIALKNQSEVEGFGIVEINNASSVKKIKNKNERGFEKNVINTTKKSVAQKLKYVGDYSNFNFRSGENMKDVSSAKKITKKEEVVSENKSAIVINIAEKENLFEDRKSNEAKAVSDRFDEEVAKIVCVARMGSLFDCEKRMIQI